MEALEDRTTPSFPPGFAFNFGGAGTVQPDAIATDVAGSVYVAGTFSGSAEFEADGAIPLDSQGGSDAFVAKYTSDGGLVWARRMGGSLQDFGEGVAVDASGAVYVVGSFKGSADFGTTTLTGAGAVTAFAAKLDANGNFTWATALGGAGSTSGADVAVDATGNLYIVGSFAGTAVFGTTTLNDAGDGDIYATKLDAAGTVLWADRMGGSGVDSGSGVAVDGSGNAFVTGKFEGSGDFGSATLFSPGGKDAFVTRLDGAGRFTWAQRMGGTQADAGLSVAADRAGNAYVVGSFQGSADFGTVTLTSAGGDDGFVTRLNETGHFTWATLIGGTGSDSVSGVVTDPEGNVYIAGSFADAVAFGPTTLTGAGYSEGFLAKMRADGGFTWARRMGGFGADSTQAVAVDRAGDVYATGSFEGAATFELSTGSVSLTSSGPTDALVAKLTQPSVSGHVWNDLNGNGVQDENEPGVPGAAVEVYQDFDATIGNGDDVSRGVAVTAYDGSYLLPDLDAGGNYYVMVRPPVGAPPPALTFTAKDVGSDDTKDSDVGPLGRTEPFTLISGEHTKRDAGLIGTVPNFGWALQAGNDQSAAGNAVVTDDAGNVYVAGVFRGTVDFDPGAGPGPGTYDPTSAGAEDGFVAMYSPAGALVWVRRMGGVGADTVLGLALDENGYTYVSGYFNQTADFGPFSLTSTSSDDAFVAKLDPTGHFVWVGQMGGASVDQANAITVDGSGNAYVTGSFGGFATFGTLSLTAQGPDDAFVVKVGTNGTFLWATRLGGTGADYGYGVAVDASGHATVTGSFEGTADFGAISLTSVGMEDIFVAQLDGFGNVVWATRMGGAQTDQGLSVAADGTGTTYVTGAFQGGADFGSVVLPGIGSFDAFVAQLDGSGTVAWAKEVGGAGVDLGSHIAVGAGGIPYVSGAFAGTVDFDPGAGATALTASGPNDGYVLKLTNAGDFEWVKQIEGPGQQSAFGATVDAGSNVFVTGSFQQTTDFDPGPDTFPLTATTGTSTSAYLVRFDGAPRVAVNQSTTQPNWTNLPTIHFTAVFTGPTVDFTGSDVVLGGTAIPTTVVVTETGPLDGTTYDLAVSGFAHDGTVTVTIPAGVATTGLDLPNLASTSYDNVVNFDTTAPAVVSVTPSTPVVTDATVGAATFTLTAVFNEALANPPVPTISFPAPGENPAAALTFLPGISGWLDDHTYLAKYTVADANVNLFDIDVRVSGGQDLAGNPQTPLTAGNVFSIDTTNPTATIAPAPGQPDPLVTSFVKFVVTFSEPVSGLTAADLIPSGTAGASKVTVAEIGPMNGTTYLATVTGMTGDGTVALQLVGGAVGDSDGNPGAAAAGPVVAFAPIRSVAVGAGPGGGPAVRTFDPVTGAARLAFWAYDPGFRGGVSVALGDVTGDGVPDVVTGAGPGGGPHVKVFDGRTGAEVASFWAFDPSFHGGVNVAAGDVNGDGYADIVVGAATGMPAVAVYDGASGALLSAFWALPVYGAGVTVAVGDVDADGLAEVIAGSAGAPVVGVFDGTTGALRSAFWALSVYGAGVTVAAGDVNGDGLAEIVIGSAGAPAVGVYDAHGVLQTAFWAPAPAGGGVTVAVVGGAVVVGAGPGSGPAVETFDAGTAALESAFWGFDPLFTGGVFVG